MIYRKKTMRNLWGRVQIFGLFFLLEKEGKDCYLFTPTALTFLVGVSVIVTVITGSTGGAAVRVLASHHYGPEFDSRTWLHMWVEFVGSLLCFEGFSPGSPVFLPPQKPTLIRSRLCSVARHESYGGSQRRPCMPSTRPRWAASPAIQPLGCEWGWLANPNLKNLILIYIFSNIFHIVIFHKVFRKEVDWNFFFFCDNSNKNLIALRLEMYDQCFPATSRPNYNAPMSCNKLQNVTLLHY